MKKLKAFLLVILLLVPISAYSAVGIGIELGGGSGSFDENDVIGQVDVDSGYANFSFVYDSNPYAEIGNFAYRLNIGLENHNYEDDFNVTMETGALVFDNTFAFTVAKSGNANIWLGPQIRVGFMSGETDVTFFGDPIELSGGMFGLGVALGTNIKTSETMGVSLSVGLRKTRLGGETKSGPFDDDFTGRVGEGYMNLALLFN